MQITLQICKLWFYVITKQWFLIIFMYSNDSKVTPSVSSMDVSRLGSNIIKVKIINMLINMQINGNLWSLKAIFGRIKKLPNITH